METPDPATFTLRARFSSPAPYYRSHARTEKNRIKKLNVGGQTSMFRRLNELRQVFFSAPGCVSHYEEERKTNEILVRSGY